MQKIISLRDKITGATRGLADGDVRGLPFEKRTMEDIATNFYGLVHQYIPIGSNTFIAEERKTNQHLPVNDTDIGHISDDTIFTLAGMKGIVVSGRIELDTLFRIHKEYIDAYGAHRFGGVRERFATFTPDKPLSHLAFPSRGNGVMMKQFPYAAYFVAAKKPYEEQDTLMEAITGVTHNSPIAKYVSLVHNRMLVTLFTSQPDTFDMGKTLDELYSVATIYESRIPANEINPNANFLVTPILRKLQEQWKSVQAGNPYSYKQILDTYLITMTGPDARGMKSGFHVASTIGLVYACFMQNMNFQGVIDAISIGQDTDSQGSMLGAMVGALTGPFHTQDTLNQILKKDVIEQELHDFQEKITEIQQNTI